MWQSRRTLRVRLWFQAHATIEALVVNEAGPARKWNKDALSGQAAVPVETEAMLWPSPKENLQQHILEGREPPLTIRQEKQYLYFGHLFPCTPRPFSL